MLRTMDSKPLRVDIATHGPSPAASPETMQMKSRRPRRKPEALATALDRPSGGPRPLPRWVEASGVAGARMAGDEGSADFAAGAAVFALDQILRTDPPWLGTWRMRLALKAAIAAARLLRLDADEAGLRDALHLTRPGDDPGPAGRVHQLIRRWCARPLRLAAETEAGIAAESGGGQGRHQSGPGELAALLAADRALAEQLDWTQPLPLHLAVINDAALRSRADGRRPEIDGPTWEKVRSAVLLKGAIGAQAQAVTLARKAEALTAAAACLRTRDEGRGLALILADDSVAPWRMSGRDGLGSDRAARRLCESLQARGALRLLTDRPTFRLYGL